MGHNGSVLVNKGLNTASMLDVVLCRWYAVERKHIDAATVLLEGRADPNMACEGGATALHAAAGADNEALVQLLLEHGAQVGSWFVGCFLKGGRTEEVGRAACNESEGGPGGRRHNTPLQGPTTRRWCNCCWSMGHR